MLFTPGSEPSHIPLIVQRWHVNHFFIIIVIFNGSESRFDVGVGIMKSMVLL